MALPQVRTLNQIVEQFRSFANQHRMNSSFACGTMDDFASSGTTLYPAIWVDYSAINFPSIREQAFVFDFFFVDRVKKDRSNLQEVLSDRAIVAGNFRAQITQPDYGWRGEMSDLEPLFEEFHEDELAGWKCTVTITQPFTVETCAIPFKQSPI